MMSKFLKVVFGTAMFIWCIYCVLVLATGFNSSMSIDPLTAEPINTTDFDCEVTTETDQKKEWSCKPYMDFEIPAVGESRVESFKWRFEPIWMEHKITKTHREYVEVPTS